MTDFDWTAIPRRPLSSLDVWELMKAGCNAAEIATAGGVSVATAMGMMRLAVPAEAGRHCPAPTEVVEAYRRTGVSPAASDIQETYLVSRATACRWVSGLRYVT